jgi:hypothetical protein
MRPTGREDKAVPELDDKRTRQRAREWVVGHWHVLGAIPFLCLAFVLIVLDRIPGAALAGAIFLALILLPDIENLKAFGLFEANLRKATDLLEKVKTVSRVNADLIYHMIGVGSRFRGLSQAEKQQLADSSDALLKDLGAPPEELSARRQAYIEYALYDLFGVFAGVVQDNVNANSHAFQARLNAEYSNDPSNPEAEGLRASVAALSNHRASTDPIAEIRTLGLGGLCRRTVPTELPESDRAALLAFADRLGSLGGEIVSSGRVTPAAIELLDRENHSPEGRRDLYKQVLGKDRQG